MTTRYSAFAAFARNRQDYFGWGYGWRFSATRSGQCATSDREIAGGTNTSRCLPISRS
ncbi:hypothetical protein [Halomonas sp. BC04]|uniref:hypothetical protein n=1 Tax=Halomonas sp. BC04 TaxID=1403540 RepID=UPI0012DCC26B|nr:hypothetical protein [Halomonas sp. BC04]